MEGAWGLHRTAYHWILVCVTCTESLFFITDCSDCIKHLNNKDVVVSCHSWESDVSGKSVPSSSQTISFAFEMARGVWVSLLSSSMLWFEYIQTRKKLFSHTRILKKVYANNRSLTWLRKSVTCQVFRENTHFSVRNLFGRVDHHMVTISSEQVLPLIFFRFIWKWVCKKPWHFKYHFELLIKEIMTFLLCSAQLRTTKRFEVIFLASRKTLPAEVAHDEACSCSE